MARHRGRHNSDNAKERAGHDNFTNVGKTATSLPIYRRRHGAPSLMKLAVTLITVCMLAAATFWASSLSHWDKWDHDNRMHLIFILKGIGKDDKLRRNLDIAVGSLLTHLGPPPLTIHFLADEESWIYARGRCLKLHQESNALVDFVYHNLDNVISQLRQNGTYSIIENLRKLFCKGYTNDDVFLLSTMLHHVLPVPKVIQLDLDIMFHESVQGLWSLFDDFSQESIMGIASEMQPVYRNVMWEYRKSHPSVGAPGKGAGFNSGVLLLHLDRMRESSLYSAHLENPTSLVNKYRMHKAHLGDQDFYSLLGWEHPELFYRLDCGWNVQLCTWWRDHGGYAKQQELFNQYHDCVSKTKLSHGNCATYIPSSAMYLEPKEQNHRAPKSDGKDINSANNLRTETVFQLQKVNYARHKMIPKDGIHVATTICGDRLFLEEALVMFRSALMSTESHLIFHVFAEDSLHSQFQKRVDEFIPDSFHPDFDLILYSVEYPPGIHASAWKRLFKPCSSLRVFLPYLINEKVAKNIIYVDTDVLFIRRIDDLWALFASFRPAEIAALTPEHEVDFMSWYKRFARHPYVPPRGVNSGVMLMMLDRMRADDWKAKMVDYLSTYRLNITWGDQDLINIYFHMEPDKLRILPCHWNYRPDHCQYGENNCPSAEHDGAFILHGNRKSFHNVTRYPQFASMYNEISSLQCEKRPCTNVTSYVLGSRAC